MLENLKYHHFLSDGSWRICNNFFNVPLDNFGKEPDYRNYDVSNVLYHTIFFYKVYSEFEKNTGTFYFDDYITEQFMENLKTMIFKMINDEYEVLKQFFNQQTNDLKNKKEILKDNNFLSYRKNAESWLNEFHVESQRR